MATFLNIESERPDGYIGLYTANIGGKEFRYVYIAHLSEPYGFSTDYPNPFNFDSFDLNRSAFGLWDSVEELKENFKKYAEAKGFDMKLTAIMPVRVSRAITLSLEGEIINPQD